MKKLLLLITLSFSLSFSVFSQEAESFTIDSTTQVVPVDQLPMLLDSLASLLDSTSNIGDIIENGKGLIGVSIKTVGNIAFVTKNAPKPNTKDGVTWWVEYVSDVTLPFFAFLTAFITAIFRLIRKSPEKAITAIEKVLSKIRTRQFVPILGIVLTAAGLIFFSEGAWSIGKAISYMASSLFGGVGVGTVYQWVMETVQKIFKR